MYTFYFFVAGIVLSVVSLINNNVNFTGEKVWRKGKKESKAGKIFKDILAAWFFAAMFMSINVCLASACDNIGYGEEGTVLVMKLFAWACLIVVPIPFMNRYQKNK